MSGFACCVVAILTVVTALSSSSGKETYVLLPRSLDFCKERSARRLTITKQISLEFGAESLAGFWEDGASLAHVCEVEARPLGVGVRLAYEEGTAEFWKLRLLLRLRLDCDSVVRLRLETEERRGGLRTTAAATATSTSTVTSYNFSCGADSAILLDTNHRKVTVSWDTQTPPRVLAAERKQQRPPVSIDLQLGTYMSFWGNFSADAKQRRCLQNGFWCPSPANVCINAQQRCDEADSCFDGGTDEQGCPSPSISNVTYNGLNRVLPPIGSWSAVVMPWIVIGAVISVLLLAMVIVCNQRRNDGIRDDHETELQHAGIRHHRYHDHMAEFADEMQYSITSLSLPPHSLSSASSRSDFDDIELTTGVVRRLGNGLHGDNESNGASAALVTVVRPPQRRSRQGSSGDHGNSCDDVEAATAGFCIRYGGRLHRLSGVPQHFVQSTAVGGGCQAKNGQDEDEDEDSSSGVWNEPASVAIHEVGGSPSCKTGSILLAAGHERRTTDQEVGRGNKDASVNSSRLNDDDEDEGDDDGDSPAVVRSENSVMTYCGSEIDPHGNGESLTTQSGNAVVMQSLRPFSGQPKADTTVVVTTAEMGSTFC